MFNRLQPFTALLILPQPPRQNDALPPNTVAISIDAMWSQLAHHRYRLSPAAALLLWRRAYAQQAEVSWPQLQQSFALLQQLRLAGLSAEKLLPWFKPDCNEHRLLLAMQRYDRLLAAMAALDDAELQRHAVLQVAQHQLPGGWEQLTHVTFAPGVPIQASLLDLANIWSQRGIEVEFQTLWQGELSLPSDHTLLAQLEALAAPDINCRMVTWVVKRQLQKTQVVAAAAWLEHDGHALAQLQQWLAQGQPPDTIAVVAADRNLLQRLAHKAAVWQLPVQTVATGLGQTPLLQWLVQYLRWQHGRYDAMPAVLVAQLWQRLGMPLHVADHISFSVQQVCSLIYNSGFCDARIQTWQACLRALLPAAQAQAVANAVEKMLQQLPQFPACALFTEYLHKAQLFLQLVADESEQTILQSFQQWAAELPLEQLTDMSMSGHAFCHWLQANCNLVFNACLAPTGPSIAFLTLEESLGQRYASVLLLGVHPECMPVGNAQGDMSPTFWQTIAKHYPYRCQALSQNVANTYAQCFKTLLATTQKQLVVMIPLLREDSSIAIHPMLQPYLEWAQITPRLLPLLHTSVAMPILNQIDRPVLYRLNARQRRWLRQQLGSRSFTLSQWQHSQICPFRFFANQLLGLQPMWPVTLKVMPYQELKLLQTLLTLLHQYQPVNETDAWQWCQNAPEVAEQLSTIHSVLQSSVLHRWFTQAWQFYQQHHSTPQTRDIKVGYRFGLGEHPQSSPLSVWLPESQLQLQLLGCIDQLTISAAASPMPHQVRLYGRPTTAQWRDVAGWLAAEVVWRDFGRSPVEVINIDVTTGKTYNALFDGEHRFIDSLDQSLAPLLAGEVAPLPVHPSHCRHCNLSDLCRAKGAEQEY